MHQHPGRARLLTGRSRHAIGQSVHATRDAQWLTVGAAASLEDAYGALSSIYPELAEMWTRFASRPIRNAGTLGGNVANGSPIGDSMPALIALDAEIVLQRAMKTRSMPLDKFYLGYQKSALEPGEFVAAIRVPLPSAKLRFRTYKVSKRYDSDSPAVCAAFAVTLDGTRVTAARFAFGGMAATPKRASNAEAVLVNQEWNEANVKAAMQALDVDFQPLTDMRASSAYEKQSGAQRALAFLPGNARRAARTPRRQRVRVRHAISRIFHRPYKRSTTSIKDHAMNKRTDPLLDSAADSEITARTGETFDAPSAKKPEGAAIGVGLPHESAHLHVSGEATYVDDIGEVRGTLACGAGPVVPCACPHRHELDFEQGPRGAGRRSPC